MPPSIDVLTSSSAPAWPTALMALKSPLPSPNVMVPKQSFETKRPVLPSVAYSMMLPFLCSPNKVLPGDSLAERIKRAFRQKPRGDHLADLSLAVRRTLPPSPHFSSRAPRLCGNRAHI